MSLARTLCLVAAAAVLLPLTAVAADGPAYSGRGFARLSGGTLFYDVAGTGEPVVLIHGGQLDSRMWEPQFAAYARDFRVLRYDVRGYGGSPAAALPYSNSEDLAALLDYLHLDKVHLVGLSLGGMIATDFAITYPARVASLVLSGPGLTGFDNDTPEEVARFVAMIYAARDGGADKLLPLWLSDPLMAPAMENPRLAPLLDRIARENVGAWLNNYKLLRVPRPPTAGRLGEIKVPTLVLVGDRDTPSIKATVDKVVAEVVGAKKVGIAGAGHMVNLEKPAEFDAAVLGFLRGLKAEKAAPH